FCFVRLVYRHTLFFIFLFFTTTPTTEIYTLSLHDALPISRRTASITDVPPPTNGSRMVSGREVLPWLNRSQNDISSATSAPTNRDRKSTRLNSSHLGISYAVFCLKKKKNKTRKYKYRKIYK